MWNSVIGTPIRARLPYDERERLKENTNYINRSIEQTPTIKGSPINSTIQRLRVQTELNSPAVDTYCRYLATHPGVQYVPNCLIREGISTDIETFPKADENTNTLLIPLVLKEFGRDHIVCLYIKYLDDKTAVIEFYDSKGLTLADRANETLANNPDMTLGKLVAQVADHYCGDREVTIEQNTTKHQEDSHNCGVYVCHYFKERIEGTPAPEIRANQRMGYDQTFIWREEMINDLMDTFQVALLKAEDVEERPADPILEQSDDDFLPAGEDEILPPPPPEISGEFVDIPL
jgi:hypothetical protein